MSKVRCRNLCFGGKTDAGEFITVRHALPKEYRRKISWILYLWSKVCHSKILASIPRSSQPQVAEAILYSEEHSASEAQQEAEASLFTGWTSCPSVLSPVSELAFPLVSEVKIILCPCARDCGPCVPVSQPYQNTVSNMHTEGHMGSRSSLYTRD